MQRLAAALLLLHALVLTGLLAAAPLRAAGPEPVDPKAADAKKAMAPVDQPKTPVPGGSKDKSALWWNDPGITKVLSLTDEQQKKMGEYLKTYRAKVPRDRRPDAFHETLVQGNWKNARAENEKVAEAARTSVRMRGRLKIDVLSVLTEKQQQLLVDRYPRLIYKPWKRAMRGDSPR